MKRYIRSNTFLEYYPKYRNSTAQPVSKLKNEVKSAFGSKYAKELRDRYGDNYELTAEEFSNWIFPKLSEFEPDVEERVELLQSIMRLLY